MQSHVNYITAKKYSYLKGTPLLSEERFDYAKKLKEAMSDLLMVGEKLGKFEVEKRRAVEMEDFDTAKRKKVRQLRNVFTNSVYFNLMVFILLVR